MGRATDKMLSFARDIADELCLDMPTKKDESGNVVPGVEARMKTKAGITTEVTGEH